jgi:hypothetical protein
MRIHDILFWNNDPPRGIVLARNSIYLRPNLLATRQISQTPSQDAGGQVSLESERIGRSAFWTSAARC